MISVLQLRPPQTHLHHLCMRPGCYTDTVGVYTQAASLSTRATSLASDVLLFIYLFFYFSVLVFQFCRDGLLGQLARCVSGWIFRSTGVVTESETLNKMTPRQTESRAQYNTVGIRLRDHSLSWRRIGLLTAWRLLAFRFSYPRSYPDYLWPFFFSSKGQRGNVCEISNFPRLFE